MKKFKAILIIALIFTGFCANAATQEELQAQINLIQTLIAQIQQQIAIQQQVVQAQPQQQGWCHNFNTNLKLGDISSEVSSLRYVFSQHNFITMLADVDANVFFDNDMFSAAVNFQEKYASEILYPLGLTKGTGFVGPSTRAKLNQIYGCRPVYSADTQSSNLPLAITDISGPTTINTGQSGTWTVNANGSGSLSYSVNWEDEDFFGQYFNTGATFTDSSIFTHTFSSAGTYSIEFTAKDETGETVSKSINITVTNTAQ